MNLNFAKKSTGIIMLLAIVLVCLLSGSFAYAGDVPSFSIGAFGGFAISMTDEAVKDYQDTEWETGTAYGGSVMYRMANGLFFELLAEQFEMKAVENGDDIGTLKATPILLMVGYQSMPINMNGIAFHATIGGGFASSKLEKGDGITDLEKSSGVKRDISNDDAFMFEMGAGIDYFLSRNIALTLDGRFMAGNIDSKWDASNGNSEDYTFYASNFQVLAGARLWF
jgi:opacity protein-like surface antigen